MMADARNDTSQKERAEVLKNDRELRGLFNKGLRKADASTFQAFAESEAAQDAGRFAQVNKATVVGANAGPVYPPLPSGHWPNQSAVVPNVEPPLGQDVNAMEPVGLPHEIEASFGTVSVSTTDDVAQGAPALDSSPASAHPLRGAPEVLDRAAPLSVHHQPELGRSGVARSSPKPQRGVR